jgi:3-keto-L-gulonate-6-phosphate decarboxylase
MVRPWVQVAIDSRDIDTGLVWTKIALAAGADWIETGSPLIVFEGVRAIGALAQQAGTTPVVADFKAQDGVAKYFLEAGRQGAKIATVLGIVADGSVKAAVLGGKEAGVKVMADMFSIPKNRLAARAEQLQRMGVDYLLLHLGHDEARDEPHRHVLDGLEELTGAVTIPVGVATFTKEEAVEAVRRGASFVVQGHPLLEPDNAMDLLGEFIQAVKSAG